MKKFLLRDGEYSTVLNSSIPAEKTMQSFSNKFLNAINPQMDYFDASKGFRVILLTEV